MPFTLLNDHTLYYTDLPPDDNASAKLTLIFVHGLGSSQNYYYPILPSLTAKGFRCVVFDNYLAARSFREDEWKQNPETSIATIGKDVLGLLDRLQIDKAVVVGYSMGGMLPTHLAAAAPERVLAGICIGPVHPSEQVADVFKQRVPVVQDGGIETMANTIPYRATGSRATPLHKAFIREMLLAQDPRGYIANCKAIEKATPPDYARVKCPILIIAGEEDKSAPLEGCKFILGELATEKKKLEVLKQVGHWHCVEATEEVAQLVGGFCDGLSSL